MIDAGLPEGVLSYISGAEPDLGRAVVLHPGVAAVRFTGSTNVEHEVASLAHRAGKRYQVEMGGNNALVVLADAETERAVAAIVAGAFGGSGQKCTATERVFIEESIASALINQVVDKTRLLKVGPGGEEDVSVGPLVSAGAVEKARVAVSQSVTAGAEVVLGRHPLSGASYDHGHFFPPAVLVAPTADIRSIRDEVFGPVVSIMPVDGLGQA
jgi:acyl-CoA reductase-like NAD-dependent aldehyde dehydrogenase